MTKVSFLPPRKKIMKRPFRQWTQPERHKQIKLALKTLACRLRGVSETRAVKRPKLGPWVGVIDAILEEDKTRPAKQRHTEPFHDRPATCLSGGSRCVGGEDVVELAPGMRPTCCFDDPASFVEWMKPGIGVRLKSSLEAPEMGLRVLSAAIGREGEPDSRWNRIGAGPAIAYIGPEPSGLRFSVARCKYQHGGVVCMKPGG